MITSEPEDSRPLIAHVVFRFAVGGLENGLVNLINRMPSERYRHSVIALTDCDPGFCARITRPDVKYISLKKRQGHGIKQYPALYRTIKALRPAIVHTRNLAALEATAPAWAAGVPVRLHGEHGRDVGDLNGDSRLYQWVRRVYRPFVTRYIALSRDLERYLVKKVGITGKHVKQIYNGVDTDTFRPPTAHREVVDGCPFGHQGQWIVGTVGRMQTVKDQVLLARAFVRALELSPQAARRLRLVMIGDGPLRAQADSILAAGGASELAWLPGERHDVPALMRGLDCFVLPSLAEGISNTILEAMATGIPVIATNVGGNAELVDAGKSGSLVPAGDVDAMAIAILGYCTNQSTARSHGIAGRRRVEQLFSLNSMVSRYCEQYDALLATRLPQYAEFCGTVTERNE